MLEWLEPHVKFIWEKQNIAFILCSRFSSQPTFWCHQNQRECKLYRIWVVLCFLLVQPLYFCVIDWIWSHWTRSKQTLFSYEGKSGNSKRLKKKNMPCFSQSKSYQMPRDSSHDCCNKSKHLLLFLELWFVYCVDKLCDCVWGKWIVQIYECLAESEIKWVRCRWCMSLIHYSWDGWAECKWQWQTETPLLKCINSSRVLDLIFWSTEAIIGIRHRQE